jgi:ornithine cyclodeaminase/alanine dehydrogenase-like protein (mu-crystallin family)
MKMIEAAEVDAALEPRELIDALRVAFRGGCEMPVRHHHHVKVDQRPDGTLLLMPAWREGGLMGLKCLTVYPGNPAAGLRTVMGFYALMDATTGQMLALMDATVLTAKRTAATSALAASYLAREDARRLLIVGTGTLAPYMARAHAAIRPVTRVTVFGRSREKAQAMIATLKDAPFETVAADSLESAVADADIVCCATTATAPLIRGASLKPGTHLDLVGAFKPDMREADTGAVAKARVYVDSRAGAMHEAGDLLIPLNEGVITEAHVVADLFELVRGEKPGRGSPREITLFKSVGMALEDLAAAELVYKRFANVSTL